MDRQTCDYGADESGLKCGRQRPATGLTRPARLQSRQHERGLAAKVAGRLILEGRDKILTSRPASELLFDGYKVDFMESARELVSGTLGFNFESPLPRNRFGFLYMKNGTWSRRDPGELTVFTGRNDSMRDFMLVHNWNDLRQLAVWPADTPAGNKCNQIRGTDGSQFHPGASRHQQLHIFSPMICTSIRVKFKEDTQARGIPLLRFTMPQDTFGAPRKTPANACYCTVPPQTGARSSRKINDSRCYLDGLMHWPHLGSGLAGSPEHRARRDRPHRASSMTRRSKS